MREILFRGKRKDNGEWVFGNLFIPDREDTPTQICVGTNVIRITYDVVPETVGQYIGYTDKNEKKIFDGDIITYSVDEDMDPEIALIDYDGASFVYQTALERSKNIGGTCIDDHQYWVAISDCECIGNIHDNPELMEVKEDATTRERSIF